MTLQRRHSRRLTVILGDSDPRAQDVLACEIVRVAHACGLPGASVFRGVAGYGLGRSVSTSRVQEWSAGGGPLMIVIVGDPESVDDFVAGIAPVLQHDLLTLDDIVEITGIAPPRLDGDSGVGTNSLAGMPR